MAHARRQVTAERMIGLPFFIVLPGVSACFFVCPRHSAPFWDGSRLRAFLSQPSCRHFGLRWDNVEALNHNLPYACGHSPASVPHVAIEDDTSSGSRFNAHSWPSGKTCNLLTVLHPEFSPAAAKHAMAEHTTTPTV